MKTCSCSHEIKAPAWDALPLAGNMLDGDGLVELRNCPKCDSTIGVEVSMGPGAWTHSAATMLKSALTEIHENYPVDALNALKTAREQIDIAIKQLAGCCPKSSVSVAAALLDDTEPLFSSERDNREIAAE